MNDMLRAMTYNYPEVIPTICSVLPAAWLKHKEKLYELLKRFPQFFPVLPDLNKLDDIIPSSYHKGSFADEWGCVWSNVDEGMEAIVTGHPIKCDEDIFNLEIPQNRDGRLPHGFMYLRLLDLCGFEKAMMYFAMEGEEIKTLIDKVLEYNCIQIEAKLKNNTDDIIYFGDDLGMQHGLAIGAQRWRRYLKPCYKKMYDMVHAAGKKVYMHTDGMIYEIMPDLQECGVDMINPQFRANGLDNLVRVCKGKIPICLDLDRQMFPFASAREIEEHVKECVEALYLPEGGLALNIELNYEIPLENIEALLTAVEKYRHFKHKS